MKCEVIIPVGPGHKDLVREAIRSVQIASRYDRGPFSDIKIDVMADPVGAKGRSATRNEGVMRATEEWLFFLDADDFMHPCAFRNFPVIKMGRTDKHPIAAWGTIMEYNNGVIVERLQIPTLDNYNDLLAYDPYQTLQMGHFVRREVALEFPFDENMNTGEDWNYYLRLWQARKCLKIDKPFMVNRRGLHSEGPRGATGQDWNEVVGKLFHLARQKLEAA